MPSEKDLNEVRKNIVKKDDFDGINTNALEELKYNDFDKVSGGAKTDNFEYEAVPLYGIDRPIMPKYGAPGEIEDKEGEEESSQNTGIADPEIKPIN